MRRDLVVQVVVDYGDFWENFATPYEAEGFINIWGLPTKVQSLLKSGKL